MERHDNAGAFAGLAVLAALTPPAAVAYSALVPRFYLGGNGGWLMTLIVSPICFVAAILLGRRTRTANAALSRTMARLAIIVGVLGVIASVAGWLFTFVVLSSM